MSAQISAFRLYLLALGGLATLGAVAVSSHDQSETSLFHGWRDPPRVADVGARVHQSARVLERSGLFGATGDVGAAASPAEEDAMVAQVETLLGFPQVLGAVAGVDGVYLLLVESGQNRRVKVGDQVEGGWTIERLTLYEFQAQRDGEQVAQRIIVSPPSEGEANQHSTRATETGSRRPSSRNTSRGNP